MTQTSPPETPTLPPAEPVDTTPRLRRKRVVLTAAALAAVISALLVVGWLLLPAAPGPTTLHTGTAQYAVTVAVEHAQVGMTGVDIDLAGRTASTPPPTAVVADTIMPVMGHAAEPVEAMARGGGRYHADAVMFMTTGPWELQLTITSAAGVEQLTLPVAVSG